jgi:hypothetical protein
MRVVLIAMKAGVRIAEHIANETVSIQTSRGACSCRGSRDSAKIGSSICRSVDFSCSNEGTSTTSKRSATARFTYLRLERQGSTDLTSPELA